MPGDGEAKVRERHISKHSETAHGHSHAGGDSRCLGLCRPAFCGLTWFELVAAFAVALPISYWYRVSAMPWLVKHNVMAAFQHGGFQAASDRIVSELSKTTGSAPGKGMAGIGHTLLLWVAANPYLLLLYAVGLILVVGLADGACQYFGGHSHSHSHSHSHGGADDDADADADAGAAGPAPELKRLASDDADADAADPALARAIKPLPKVKVLTQEDVKGTVRRPRSKRPFASYSVSDPVKLLQNQGRWPPPAALIIDGPKEQVRAAQEAEGAADADDEAKASTKTKTKAKPRIKSKLKSKLKR